MRTKSAIFYAANEPIRVEEVELDSPRRGEVLVRVAATGACHSDYHAVHGRNDSLSPFVMGHEGAGVVQEVGQDVTEFAAGDHVVFAIRHMCGKCEYCSSGRPNLCNGIRAKRGHTVDGDTRFHALDGTPLMHGTATFSQHTVVPEWDLVKVTDEVPIERMASIGCAVITGVGAVVRTAQVPAGASVAVWGCGGVGLNVIQGAAIAGARQIIAVDLVPKKLDFAKQFGATETINASDVDPVEAVRDRTDGGVEYAFEVIGNAPTVRQAFEATRPGGTACAVGVPPTGGEVSVPMGPLFLDRRLIGSSAGSGSPRIDFPWFIELYRQGRLKLDELQSTFRPWTRSTRPSRTCSRARSPAASCGRSRLARRRPHGRHSGRLGASNSECQGTSGEGRHGEASRRQGGLGHRRRRGHGVRDLQGLRRARREGRRLRHRARRRRPHR